MARWSAMCVFLISSYATLCSRLENIAADLQRIDAAVEIKQIHIVIGSGGQYKRQFVDIRSNQCIRCRTKLPSRIACIYNARKSHVLAARTAIR
jgi:hypothetical protein